MRVFALLPLFLSISVNAFAQVDAFVNINFKKADSVARLYPNYSLENLLDLSNKLTSPLTTDVEKFRAIYTWVCLNIENDYELFMKNQNKRKKLKDPAALKAWNKEFGLVVFKELRKNKSTICTGYAYLIRELATFAGITCVIVDGYGRTVQANVGGIGEVNHSWNAVHLNGKWYLCDATWSSGGMDLEQRAFIKKYNDVYFLLDPRLFVRNHYPIDTTYFFLSKKPTLTEFLRGPIVYVDFFEYTFYDLDPEVYLINVAKKQPVRFEFTGNRKTIQKIELQVKRSNLYDIATPNFMQTDGTLSFDHAFKSNGLYTVNIKADDKFIVTYTILVK